MVGIQEKPEKPKSNYAVIGIYLYDKSVFEKIRRLKPSGRGELEITECVNNFFIEEGTLTYEILNGWWTDAGTFDSLLRANNLAAETGANKMSNADAGTKDDEWRIRTGPYDEAFHRTGGAWDLHRIELHPACAFTRPRL